MPLEATHLQQAMYDAACNPKLCANLARDNLPFSACTTHTTTQGGQCQYAWIVVHDSVRLHKPCELTNTTATVVTLTLTFSLREKHLQLLQ